MNKSKSSEDILSYWRKHVETYKRSGLSQREYCRQQGLSYWSFNPWKRKLEADITDFQEIPKELVCSLSPVNRQIELTLKDGMRISIPDGFSEDTLKSILQVLSAVK